MSGIMQVARLTLPKLGRNFLRRPSLNCLDGMLQLAFPFLQALTPFFTLAALLAGSISLQSLPVSLITAYVGSLAAAAAALMLEKRMDHRLTGGILLYPLFMACFLPLQTLALFKTQTVWHEIRHSGVRLLVRACASPRKNCLKLIQVHKIRDTGPVSRSVYPQAAALSAAPRALAAEAGLPCSAYDG